MPRLHNLNKKVHIEECLLVMNDAAKKAGALALDMRSGIENIKKLSKNSENKGSILEKNKTALTLADIECQKIIMNALLQSYDYCGVYFEENDHEIADIASRFSHVGKLVEGKYTFLIDPIDGTRNYIEKDSDNSDKYGIYISLAYGFEIIAGTVFYPEHNDLVYTAKDLGLFINNKQCRVSNNDKFSFSDSISISPSVTHDLSGFINRKTYNSCCYNIRAFIKKEINAYYLSEIPLLDFGFLALAVKEGGGFFGLKNSDPVNLHSLMMEKNSEIFIKGFILLTTSKEYHQDMILSMENKNII